MCASGREDCIRGGLWFLVPVSFLPPGISSSFFLLLRDNLFTSNLGHLLVFLGRSYIYSFCFVSSFLSWVAFLLAACFLNDLGTCFFAHFACLSSLLSANCVQISVLHFLLLLNSRDLLVLGSLCLAGCSLTNVLPVGDTTALSLSRFTHIFSSTSCSVLSVVWILFQTSSISRAFSLSQCTLLFAAIAPLFASFPRPLLLPELVFRSITQRCCALISSRIEAFITVVSKLWCQMERTSKTPYKNFFLIEWEVQGKS